MLRSVRTLVVLVLSFVLVAVSAPTARADMSESERKAAARAAFLEGVALQDGGRAAEALAKFQSAQSLFDAPTHQIHIAQCQALTGKLVEASETYETLTRRQLPENSPEAFEQAQEQAKQELPALRQRVPTLRITVTPAPATLQNLQLTVNGNPMPPELIGIARPVNPGHYAIAGAASGYATRQALQIDVQEREQKAVEVRLEPGTAVVAAPPVYTGNTPPPPPPPFEKPKAAQTGPSSTGLLFGARGGAFVPGGKVVGSYAMSDFAVAGPGLGIDVMARLARVLTLGGMFETASLGKPDKLPSQFAGTADVSLSTYYLGANIGYLSNVDRVSFLADIGLGYRNLSRKFEHQTGQVLSQSATGLEFALGAGIMIPAGPLRIVPRAAFNFGTFGATQIDGRCGVGGSPYNATACLPELGTARSTDTAGHTMFYVGLGLLYHLDLGKKPEPAATASAND